MSADDFKLHHPDRHLELNRNQESPAAVPNDTGVTSPDLVATNSSFQQQQHCHVNGSKNNPQGDGFNDPPIAFTHVMNQPDLQKQQANVAAVSTNVSGPGYDADGSLPATGNVTENMQDTTARSTAVSMASSHASSVLMSVLQDPQEAVLLNAHRDSRCGSDTNEHLAVLYDAVATAVQQHEETTVSSESSAPPGLAEKEIPAAMSLKRSRDQMTDAEHDMGRPTAQQHNPHDSEDPIRRQKLMDYCTEIQAPVLSPQPTASPNNDAGAIKKANEQWDIMYEQLKLYKQQEGHCLVPKRQGKLGTWVETQRVQHKKLSRLYDPSTGAETGVLPNKRLTAERLQKLEAIGFAWSAKVARRNSASAAVGKHDDMDGGMPSLGTAGAPVAAPNAIAAGDGDVVTNPTQQAPQQQARRSRLNDSQWEDMFQRLVNFRNEHGHTLVPRKYDKDPKLSTWVETQRILFNRDFRNIDPKGAVAAAAATAAATSVALADYASGNTDSSGPVYESTSVMATGGAVPHQEAANASFTSADSNPEGVPLPSIPGAAMIAADRGKRLTPERKQKLDEIGFVWSLRSKRIEDHWDDMFKQLVAYKVEHGDTLVPSRYQANLKLGKWVETQRYEYTKLQRSNAVAIDTDEATHGGPNSPNHSDESTKLLVPVSHRLSRPTNPRLTEDRIRRLEEIGFQWKVKHKMKRYYDEQWNIMFDRLRAFKDVNGHVMVPKRYPAHPRLGTWVHTQRIQFRKLMSGTKKMVLTAEEESVMKSCSDEVTYRLTDERRARLESIGFVWNMREGEKGADVGRVTRNSYDDQWDVMFQKLKEYREKYGNCLVPKRYKEFPKLGTWVDTQRVQYKRKKNAAPGSADHDAASGTSAANDDKDSNCSVPNKPLLGRLTDERIRRLEEIGFVWSLRDDWQKHYEELKAFKKIHGHCNVPARYAENRRLGIWVSAQRQQHKTQLKQPNAMAGRRTAPLTQERISLLNQIGFTWTIRSRDSLGESWNLRLEELKRFKEKHGHCMVPSRYAESPELGVWVGTQRTGYRLFLKAKEKGTLVPGATAMNETRIKLLEELGFVWALRGNREDHMNLRQFHLQRAEDESGEENLGERSTKSHVSATEPTNETRA